MAAYKNLTSSAAFSAAPGSLCSVVLTAGSDAATLLIYDNATTNAGTIVCKLACTAANTTAIYQPRTPLPVAKGLYGVLTGTGVSATAEFLP